METRLQTFRVRLAGFVRAFFGGVLPNVQVSSLKDVIGRKGVRPAVHSLLNMAQTVRDHGECMGGNALRRRPFNASWRTFKAFSLQ